MAEASLPPEIVSPAETTGRKRNASEAEGSPEQKRPNMSEEEQQNILLGNYPYNTKRTCILHDHSNDLEDPQGHKCLDFETEFGNYDNNLFIDQNEAEDLLATLEVLAGKLASETQPLSLEYNPNEPAPLPLQYSYPPMIDWKNEAGGGTGNKRGDGDEKRAN